MGTRGFAKNGSWIVVRYFFFIFFFSPIAAAAVSRAFSLDRARPASTDRPITLSLSLARAVFSVRAPCLTLVQYYKPTTSTVLPQRRRHLAEFTIIKFIPFRTGVCRLADRRPYTHRPVSAAACARPCRPYIRARSARRDNDVIPRTAAAP